MSKKIKVVVWMLQSLIAIAALVYIMTLADMRRSWLLLEEANIGYYLLTIPLLCLSYFVLAVRWVLILKQITISFSIVSAYGAYLAGAFAGIFIPGMIGGDAVRIWLCHKKTASNLVTLAIVSMTEKFLGLIMLGLLLAAGLIITNLSVGLSSIQLFSLTIISAAIIILIPEISKISLRFFSVNKKIPSLDTSISTNHNDDEPFPKKIREILKDFFTLLSRTSKTNIILVFILTFLSHIIDIAAASIICESFALDINFGMLLVAIPISYLAIFLPLSPGGIGVREGVLVATLALFGIAAQQGAILALAIFFNRTAVGLIGGAVMLYAKTPLKKLVRDARVKIT